MSAGKILLFFLVNGLLTISVFAQSQQSFAELIQETNDYLNVYEGIPEFGDYDHYISFTDSGLPKEYIKELQADEEYAVGLSEDKDSITEEYLIGEIQALIIEHIYRIIAHDKLPTNNVAELISQNELSIIQSMDGKLYNFSLNEKTGGSYSSRISIMHFTAINPNDFSQSDKIEDNLESDPYAIFEKDGYNEIHSINTKEGTKYLLIGYVRGCSYCFETHITLVKFEQGIFQQEFLYSVNSRSWEGGIAFDPINQIIQVDYETDDLMTSCYCTNFAEEEQGEEEYSEYEEEEPIIKNCHCTFEFNGVNFELVKEGWEKIKKRN